MAVTAFSYVILPCLQQLLVDNFGTSDFIRQQARFYGKKDSNPTPYQERVNIAAEELALCNPQLLHDRQLLLSSARQSVDESGYQYKKGKSRSKHHDSSQDDSTPKRTEISETVRLECITSLEEKIKDVKEQIMWKERRREQASNAKKYHECEDITVEMGT